MENQDRLIKISEDLAGLISTVNSIKEQVIDLPARVVTLENSVKLLNKVSWTIACVVIVGLTGAILSMVLI